MPLSLHSSPAKSFIPTSSFSSSPPYIASPSFRYPLGSIVTRTTPPSSLYDNPVPLMYVSTAPLSLGPSSLLCRPTPTMTFNVT
mmetsp:Transcript_7330/g.14453  ORF Transcript_7330/g.14453 Transcript_7330/m.14453 type:complete len:84 (+) Transcript_7330:502-753(+)